VDSEGFVYTWGFGGHGRLGHKEQKDEWIPRLVEVFTRGNILPSTAVISAGSAYSAATAVGGQLYMWGRVKMTGDNWMYPKPVIGISGWNIRSLDSGNLTTLAAAEESCISWGTAYYGELGYGPTGPKSSANPKKIDAIEGCHVISVACGVGHSLVIVDRKKNFDKIEQLEVFEGVESEQVTLNGSGDHADEPVSDKKRKAPAKGRGKAAKAESESDEEFDEESDEDPKPKGRGRGAARGRGRGKGVAAKNGHSTDDAPPAKKGRGQAVKESAPVAASESAPAPKGRGRGRPRGSGKK